MENRNEQNVIELLIIDCPLRRKIAEAAEGVAAFFASNHLMGLQIQQHQLEYSFISLEKTLILKLCVRITAQFQTYLYITCMHA